MKSFFILFATILFDQITKTIIRFTMFVGQSIPVLGDFFRITFVENRGIAFGIQVSHGWLFTLLSGLASVFVAFYLYKVRHEVFMMRLGLLLILGGAIGNLIDRILRQRVVDFLDFGIGTIRWPVFNVADSAVVIGMAFLIYFTFLEEKRRKHMPAEAQRPVE